MVIMKSTQAATKAGAKALNVAGFVFNPVNSVALKRLDEEYLNSARQELFKDLKNDEIIGKMLEVSHVVSLYRSIEENPKVVIDAKSLDFSSHIRLSWLQALHGNITLFSSLIDRLPDELVYSFISNAKYVDKKLLTHLMPFLKHHNTLKFIQMRQDWPENLEKIITYGGDFYEYVRLSNRLKPPKEKKQLFTNFILPGYALPLVVLDSNDQQTPIFLKDLKTNLPFEYKLEIFLMLLNARDYSPPNQGWVCEYNSDKKDHIHKLAHELNRKLGFLL